MIITFKNADERKKHPQAGLIPNDVWSSCYFENKIDEKVLAIIVAKPEKLLEKIMSLNVYHCEPEYKDKMLAALFFGHSNLSLDTFNNIFCNSSYFCF